VRQKFKLLRLMLSMSLVAAAVVAITVPAAAHDDEDDDRDRGERETEETIELQFLSISDWHGQLDPLFVFGQGLFGGAAELSTYFQQERANNPNTLTLTAGDAFGASLPLSSFFNEAPSVEAMNLMGFDADTLGNHNFDKGVAHLQEMVDIADFPYLSANLKNVDDELDGVEPYKIFEMDGVKVAVIGITNPEAPTLVFPDSFGTIVPTDPIKAVKKARKKAKKEGAQIFVVIAHMGVTSFDTAGNPVGPLVDLANGVKGIDLILGDHTGVQYSGVINEIQVVENASRGRTYSRVTMEVEKETKVKKNGRVKVKAEVENIVAEFVDPVSSAVTPDPAIVALLDPLRAQLNVLLGNVVGMSNVFIPRADSCGTGNGRTCESLVGDVVTDAMRTTYGTDFAITNSGGLRADLTCPDIDNPSDFCGAQTPGGPYDITAGQVLTVLPFGNVVVTVDMTGAELKTHLENGVSAMPGVSGRFAQVSGLCVTYDISAASGSRVTSAVRQAADGTCTGPAVDLTAAATYSVALNDFMSSGGDGYPVTINNAVTRDFMDAIVSSYITNLGVITPTIENRIVCTGGTVTVPCPVAVP